MLMINNLMVHVLESGDKSQTLQRKTFLKYLIRKTCPCNEYPLKPHFYLVKLGYAGVCIPIFLIFGPNHRFWVHV